MATYVNDLRLKEIATGDESGTWGTSTNTNLELIANAMGLGAETIPNASTHTITMADGTADEFRSTFLRLTGGGTACTVTLAPNTLSHTWIMRNETAAALTLTQGSGANVTIAAGQTKIVSTDGGGAGAIVYEMDDLELAGNLAVTGTATVVGTTTSGILLKSSSGASNGFKLYNDSGTDTAHLNNHFSGSMVFSTNNTERMRLTAAGALQLSDVNSPNDINTAIYSNSDVLEFEAFGTNGAIAFATGSSVTERMRIDSSGSVGIGKTPLGNNLSPALEMVSGGTMFGYGDAMYLTGNLYYNDGWKAIATGAGASMILDATGPKFYTNASASAGGTVTPTERMRIDSSGNLLVGKTASNSTVAGAQLNSNGLIIGTTSETNPLLLNRLSTDGDIITMQKGGVPVGSLGTIAGYMTAGTSDTGVVFHSGEDNIQPWNVSTNAGRDNAIDLGVSNARFKDLYLSEGINLSADDGGGVGTNTIGFKHTGNTAGYAAAIEASYSADFRANLIFKINTSQSNIAPIEVGRFSNGGNLLVGTTTSRGRITATGADGVAAIGTFVNAAINYNAVSFHNNAGTQVGRILANNAGTTQYITSSDQRLKENIADADDAGSKVDAIQVRKFDWKADGSHQAYGMIAQELQTVAPDAVAGEPDSEEVMGVDYSKLVPMLVKEIQSLRARVNALEAE